MSPTIVKIKPSGLSPFPTQAVGESRYKDNLLKVCGDYDAKEGFADDTLAAELTMEDDNPYDLGNAVAIRISAGFDDDVIVGYLSKQDAAAYRLHLVALGYTGQAIGICGASIKGGFIKDDEVADFGVRLDFVPDNFEIESNPTKASIPESANQQKSQKLPSPPLIPAKGSGCLYYVLVLPLILILDFYILLFWLLWVILWVIWRFFNETPQRQKIGLFLLALVVLAYVISAIAQTIIK